MTTARLNLTTKLLAFSDSDESSNPRLKNVDWFRDMTGMDVENPTSKVYTITAGSSKTVFDGTYASTIDGTTTFALSLSTLDSSRYRITHTGGTAPGFRTGRSLALNGVSVTFTANANGTLTATVPAGPDFTNVQVGDSVFIPHTTTGDSSSPVSVLNAGLWQVLGKASNTSITLMRPTGTDFEGVTQTVALTSNNQIRAYSAAGLQEGDKIDIQAGFSLSNRKTFEVLVVTDLFVEFISTVPLAVESGIIPTNSGLVFYTESKKVIYIEGNQEFAVRVNGDTGNYQRMSPPDPSNASLPAVYMRLGPTWLLSLVNLSSQTLNVLVIDAE